MTEEPRPARFDPAVKAWVLSRHADVAAALREPLLRAAGAPIGPHRAPEPARRAMDAAHVEALRGTAESAADALMAELPGGVVLDLVAAFAQPWSLTLAVAATRAVPDDAPRLAALARIVFLDAANAVGPDTGPEARDAIVTLAGALARAGAANAALAAQTFVALTQTLPCTLAAAWLALIEQPETMRRLRERPDEMPATVEELLRVAGPSRAVFRVAHGDVSIGEVAIRAGERVVLRLAAANHDPARFADPDRLDVERGGGGHLALGRGAHACYGAPLVRMAVAIATRALLRATTDIEPAGTPRWIGGFAIDGPATLPVVLRRR